MKGISKRQRLELADRLLAYLAAQPQRNWPSTQGIMRQAWEQMTCQPTDVWKAYELLRTLGRIELNNRNGRKGFHLLDITPLTMPGISVESSKKGVSDGIYRVLRQLAIEFPEEFDAVGLDLNIASMRSIDIRNGAAQEERRKVGKWLRSRLYGDDLQKIIKTPFLTLSSEVEVRPHITLYDLDVLDLGGAPEASKKERQL